MTSHLERALSDFLETLSALNRELNGNQPSEQTAGNPPMLPSTLVYAITEVIRMLRHKEETVRNDSERETLRRLAWRAETGWSAVLAGDIDDIRAHIQEEEAMRSE